MRHNWNEFHSFDTTCVGVAVRMDAKCECDASETHNFAQRGFQLDQRETRSAQNALCAGQTNTHSTYASVGYGVPLSL